MSVLGNNLLAQYYAQNQGLPFGYEAVEYLESTGTQYIDTNISSFDIIDKTLVYKGELQGISSYTITQIIIGINSYGGGWFGIPAHLNYYGLASDIVFQNAINEKVYVECSLTMNNSYFPTMTCSLNRNMPLTRTSNFGRDRQNNFTLFSVKINSSFQYFASARLYKEQKIYLDNILIRNFIPCIRKSDGKPGLYDLCKSICPLTNTPFYINAGTGEFVIPT